MVKLAVASLILACLCTAGAAVAVYTRAELLDTGEYVAAVAPLAANRAIQDAVAARVEEGITESVTVPPAARPILHGAVVRLIASPEFRAVWTVANRLGHEQLVAVLTGRGAVTLRGNTVQLDLGPLVRAVQRELDRRGYHDLDGIAPALAHVRFPVLQSSTVGHVRRGFRVLDTLAWMLPFAALALLVVAVWRWPHRSRGLLWSGVGPGLTAGGLLAALAASRCAYLREIPPRLLPHDAAAAFFDALTSTFWLACWISLGVAFGAAAIVAIVARSRPNAVGELRPRDRPCGPVPHLTVWVSLL